MKKRFLSVLYVIVFFTGHCFAMNPCENALVDGLRKLVAIEWLQLQNPQQQIQFIGARKPVEALEYGESTLPFDLTAASLMSQDGKIVLFRSINTPYRTWKDRGLKPEEFEDITDGLWQSYTVDPYVAAKHSLVYRANERANALAFAGMGLPLSPKKEDPYILIAVQDVARDNIVQSWVTGHPILKPNSVLKDIKYEVSVRPDLEQVIAAVPADTFIETLDALQGRSFSLNELLNLLNEK